MKKIFLAEIFHKRLRPRVNQFSYSGFYIKFDIDDINDLETICFKVNRVGMFSFYEKDHGHRDGTSLRNWADKQLQKAGIKGVDRIVLQTIPRVLGYVFNPVSFWFCYSGNNLVAIINEVNNTFNESHTYLIKKRKQRLPKEFHVSPFFDVKGEYSFDFSKNNKARINYYFENQLMLSTSIEGKEIAWKNSTFLKLFFLKPLYTIFVVFLIHFQALKLFLKKIKFYKQPVKNSKELTYEHNN
jgi:DUF1365 family protein